MEHMRPGMESEAGKKKGHVAGKLEPLHTRRNQMSNKNAVVGIYKTHPEAEAAVKELQKSGFDMKKPSVVGKDYHTEENVVGFYNAGDRMKF